MEADRRPEGTDRVRDDEDRDVDPVEGDAPQQAHREQDPERRHDHRDERDDLADPARPLTDGADLGAILLGDLHGGFSLRTRRDPPWLDNRSSTMFE